MYQGVSGSDEAFKASPDVSRTRSRFAKTAAKICFWLLFVGLLIVISCIALLGPPRTSESVKTAGFAATGFLWLCGICFGVVAVKETKQHGSKGLFWGSLCGVVMNGVLFAAMSYLLVYRYQWTVQNAKAETLLQNFTKEAWLFSNAYITAGAMLTNPPVLSMALVKEKGDLEARKMTVLSYIAASQELETFWTSAAARLEEELSRAKLSPDVREKYLQHYIRSSELDRPEALKFRRVDILRGQAWLDFLNLLEQNWGKWTYDPNTGSINSTNEQFRDNFARRMEKMTELKSEANQLRKQFEEQRSENLKSTNGTLNTL